jgi:broad specificity phosphatase PhoE
MIDLILVRHGETNENKKGILQGQTEGILSVNGIKQNKALAEQLKNFKIDAIYSSPLIRAVETGREIFNFHRNIEFKKDSRLVERNMGILQGQKIPESYDLQSEVEGMESLESIEKRISFFLQDILNNHMEQSILLVSHGITIQVITAMIKRIAINEIDNIKLLDNSTYSIFQIDGDCSKSLCGT